MKITFKDTGYIEIRKAEMDKIHILICSRDLYNHNTKITNSCEITAEEFKKLISDIV